jgi:hypothetical protein
MSARTIVYVDGFNFYYGCVRGTPWKWLNLETLFQSVLDPEKNNILKVKYFTARVQPTPNDPGVHARQDAYFRALVSACPLVEFHFGHFLRHKVRLENASPPPATVEVWKNEEKGSDVNLAVSMLDDCWRNKYDCAVVVSNDSDLALALSLVRAKQKTIGLVTPGAPLRKTSAELRKNSSFIRHIRPHHLSANQLADPIPGTTITKPPRW